MSDGAQPEPPSPVNDAMGDETPRRFREPQTNLSAWMGALIGYVRSGQPDLTNRQMALMLCVYLTPGPHTVRGLARILGVSKPVITRALNTLGGLGYLRRERDQADKRNVFVAKTDRGASFLEGFGQNLRAGVDGIARGVGLQPASGAHNTPGLQPAFAA